MSVEIGRVGNTECRCLKANHFHHHSSAELYAAPKWVSNDCTAGVIGILPNAPISGRTPTTLRPRLPFTASHASCGDHQQRPNNRRCHAHPDCVWLLYKQNATFIISSVRSCLTDAEPGIHTSERIIANSPAVRASARWSPSR